MKQYVVISHSRWSSAPSRIQQIVTRLGEAEILFFQPSKGRGDRSHEKPGKLVRPNITLHTLPPVHPLHRRFSLLEAQLIKKQAKWMEKRIHQHGFQNPALWLTSPDQVSFSDHLPFKGLIYDCDRFWPAALDNRESELACAADLIFAASPLLKRRLSPCSSNVALIPNGVNFPMFDRKSYPLPQDVSDLPSPILGYVGSIDSSLDLQPIQTAATLHPEWTILLVGPVTNSPAVRQLSACGNVHFTGFRSIVDIPDYLGNCHVLLNLRRTEDAHSDVIPSRIYEYLSTGRPIVSLLLPEEVEEFPDVIYSAHTPVEFVRLCEKALQEDPGWVSSRRRDYGASASWSNRADTIRQILNAIAL